MEKLDKIGVLIVDDHEVVRRGLRKLVENEPDIRVLGEAGDATEAIKMIIELQPNVALVDIKLPGSDGFSVVSDIASANLETRVIMITAYESALYVAEAITHGAKGLITKESTCRIISSAIRLVAAGSTVWPANLLNRALMNLTHSSQLDVCEKQHVEIVQDITPLERQLLSYLGNGLSNKEIASALNLPVDTIKKRVQYSP